MSAAYSLPAGVQLEYLAEGAANIVYRINWPPSASENADNDGTRAPPIETDLHSLPSPTSATTPPPTEIEPSGAHSPPETYPPPDLHNRLLRLRKAVPWIPSYAQLHENQAKLITPYFPSSQVVSQTLVAVPSSLIHTANAALHAAEETTQKADESKAQGRPLKRHGLYLATDEPHGLLVEDMSANESKGEALVEIKAKWLAQSPNAPQDSPRCRTCALRAMRREQQAHGTESSGAQSLADVEKDFCPLALASGDPFAVDAAVRAILVGAFGNGEGEAAQARMGLHQALVMFFVMTPILPRLRALQEGFDPNGILGLSEGEVPGDEFLVATTLRDCTLFLRSSVQGGAHSVDGKLGDLDLKAPEPGKIEYWRGLERDLIEGGWYAGVGSDGKCWLESEQMPSW